MRTSAETAAADRPAADAGPDPERARVLAEVLSGSGLSLTGAAKLLPSSRGGRPTHSSTVWRWCMKGVRLPDGRKLRLGAVKVSGHFATSRQALARFIDAQTPDLDADPAPTPRPPSERRRSSAAADRELRRRGC